jgi:hypothetical protein
MNWSWKQNELDNPKAIMEKDMIILDSCKLNGYAPGESGKLGAYADQFDVNSWIDLQVPGDIHRTVLTDIGIELWITFDLTLGDSRTIVVTNEGKQLTSDKEFARR